MRKGRKNQLCQILTISQVRWEPKLNIGFSSMIVTGKKEWFEGCVANLQFQMYKDCGRKANKQITTRNPVTTWETLWGKQTSQEKARFPLEGKARFPLESKTVKGVFEDIKNLEDFLDKRPWIPEGKVEEFHELGRGEEGNRSEAVQSLKRIKVTDMRGDWDPGLLMTDVDGIMGIKWLVLVDLKRAW